MNYSYCYSDYSHVIRWYHYYAYDHDYSWLYLVSPLRLPGLRFWARKRARSRGVLLELPLLRPFRGQVRQAGLVTDLSDRAIKHTSVDGLM